MPRYLRPRLSGATVFFTVALIDRQSDLLIRHIDLLREAVRITRAKRPFGIAAWVVLPDHLHCLWTLPEDDADFSSRMGEIKGHFSRRLRRAGLAPTCAPPNPYGAVGGRVRVGASPDLQKDEVPIWQKRFWEHHIRNADDFQAHMRLCRMDPVLHGLVERPEDWPFTSCNRAQSV